MLDFFSPQVLSLEPSLEDRLVVFCYNYLLFSAAFHLEVFSNVQTSIPT